MVPGFSHDYSELVIMLEQGCFTKMYHLIVFNFEEWEWVHANILGLNVVYKAPKWMADIINGREYVGEKI